MGPTKLCDDGSDLSQNQILTGRWESRKTTKEGKEQAFAIHQKASID